MGISTYFSKKNQLVFLRGFLTLLNQSNSLQIALL